MDIFTTALTKVVPVTIKPESLKVKALIKDSGPKALSDDSNHLENHEQYYAVRENNKDQNSSKNHKKHDENDFEQGIKASEDVIIHKDEILHPKEHNKDGDDEDITHLDIFI